MSAVQEHLRLAMHWLGQHVQDSVQTHSEIRRQTDENHLNDYIRKGKCRQRKQIYEEYAEYAEYEEYAKIRKNT